MIEADPRATPRRNLLRLLILFVVIAFSTGSTSPASGQASEDPLEPFRGKRVAVEFPELDDVGRKIPVPRGWAYLQVTTETYDHFSRFLDPRFSEAILFFDEHGNYVAKLHGDDRMARFEPGLEEVDKRIKGWVRTLDKEWTGALEAKRTGKGERELKHLLEIRGSKLVGYPEIAKAEKRLAELEVSRMIELWQLLAREGVAKNKQLERDLAQLRDKTAGLAIGKIVDREWKRVKDGRVTAPKPRAAP